MHTLVNAICNVCIDPGNVGPDESHILLLPWRFLLGNRHLFLLLESVTLLPAIKMISDMWALVSVKRKKLTTQSSYLSSALQFMNM